jgi:signal transduction histidine kinase
VTSAVGGQRSAESLRFRFGRWALLFDFVFWTLFAVLISLNRVLGPRGPRAPSSQPVVETLFWFFEAYLWAAATPLIFWLAWRSGTRRRGIAARVLPLLAAGVILSVLMDLLGSLAAEHLLHLPRFGPPRAASRILLRPWELVSSPWFLTDIITYAGVVAAGFAWEYFLRYQVREAEAARLHAQLAEARLTVLRTQLDPHFLFNTLNAVSALVARDPKGVRRMIARLSELLRHTLDGSGDQEIPLREELYLIRRYLEILEIRYQGRLQTAVSADAEVEDALVPNLVLQPLAENAVTHGIAKAGGYGRIEVHARREGDRLVLTVRDTGAGDAPPTEGEPLPETIGQGMGLGNTRARLAELYGAAQSLTLRPVPGGGTAAEVVLPFRVPEEPAPIHDPARARGGVR